MIKSLSSNRFSIITRTKVVKYLFNLLILMSIGFFTQGVSEALQIYRSNEFTFDVSDDYQCGDELEATINAKDRGMFYGDLQTVRQVLTFVRAELVSHGMCSKKDKIETIKIIGVVNGERVYEGRATKEGLRWKVVNNTPKTAVVAKKDDSRGEPLFSNDAISVYPHDIPVSDRNWAKKKELDIVYNYEYKSTYRDSRSGHLAAILYPIIGGYFSDYFQNNSFRVYYYSAGEKDYWELVTYKFGGWRSNKPQYVEVQRRWLGDTAKKEVEKVASRHFGECTEKGFLCDYPGGRYLNAIYRNDTALVDTIDKTCPYGSYLIHVANQYMFNYGKTVYYNGQSSYNSIHSRECLGPGARTKVFSTTTDIIRYQNIYGMDMGSVGGDTFTATYNVNPEFYPLLMKIGGPFGDSLQKLGAGMNKNLDVVLDGVNKIQVACDCSSPEVKQFEKNLISLTTRYLQTFPTE